MRVSDLSKKTFVREATGLVREIGFSDYMITNLNGVTLTLSLVITPWFIWYAIPGGDVIIGAVGGFILSILGTIVVFAMMSATFPRSASPYVAESRALHPAIGWPSEVMNWLGYCPITLSTIGTSLISWGLVPGLYTIGVSSGNTSLVSMAFALTKSYWMATVSILLVLGTMAITMLGTRKLVRAFQLPMTILMVIGTLVLMAYWSSGSLTQLQAVLPKYTNMDYADILKYANATFPAAMVPVSVAFLPVLNSIMFTVGSFNSYWGAWAVGETKRGDSVRMNYLAMAIPSIVLFTVVLYTIAVAQAAVGRDFLVAMTQILSNTPGFLSSVPSVAGFSTITLVPMMLADNPVVQFLIMIGVIGGVLGSSVYTWLIVTRDFFAWSFDRLLPAKFAAVNDRTHTPVFNIAVNAAIACVFSIIISYGSQYIGYAMVSGFALTVLSVGVLMLAGILIPLRKDIWRNSPASKYKILGIPVISIAGILGLIYQIVAVYFYIVTAGFGWGPQASEFLVATMIVPFILYWVVRRIRISQGIDIDLIFRSIPPE